jgi:hypothetical protein
MTVHSNDRGSALFVALAAFAASVACSGEPVPASPAVNAPSVDMMVPPPGIPDLGYDPAVVAIDAGRASACAGTLIAPDIVLTARHCVTATGAPLRCPADGAQPADVPAAPGSLRVLVGDEVSTASERARARAVIVPPDAGPCGADVAVLLLDQPIDDVKPLVVRPTGAAKGDHVRTVAFTRSEEYDQAKRLRDHIAVSATTASELQLAESMNGSGGGPALDEATVEVLGVVSRTDDEAAADVYTRSDAFLSLVESALAQSISAGTSQASARKPTKGPVDMGANCVRGADCAAGVCVTDAARQYCSRTCGADDRCPAHFRCEVSDERQQICVAD